VRAKTLTKRSLYDLAFWKNGLAFKNIQFSSKGKPVIKIAELKNGITDQTKFTQVVFDDSVALRSGDMLFSWSGNPETSIDVFYYDLPEGWLNQHIFKVTPVNVDRGFLFYLLKYCKPKFTSIASNKQTTGLGHVTVKDLKELIVDVPSMEMQKAIADTLTALDAKIVNNTKINNHLASPRSATHSSPDIRRGSRESRRVARWADSFTLFRRVS
jgi:type I restriction enzyme S subunit